MKFWRLKDVNQINWEEEQLTPDQEMLLQKFNELDVSFRIKDLMMVLN